MSQIALLTALMLGTAAVGNQLFTKNYRFPTLKFFGVVICTVGIFCTFGMNAATFFHDLFWAFIMSVILLLLYGLYRVKRELGEVRED